MRASRTSSGECIRHAESILTHLGDRNLKREVLGLYFLTKYLFKQIFKNNVISRSVDHFDGNIRQYLCTKD